MVEYLSFYESLAVFLFCGVGIGLALALIWVAYDPDYPHTDEEQEDK